MKITTYSADHPSDSLALRIGITREPPPGCCDEGAAGGRFCDIWLPALAPSPTLARAFRDGVITFRAFASRYRAEMGRPRNRGLLSLISLFARIHPVGLGCVCRNLRYCHGRILKELLETMASPLAEDGCDEPRKGASPVCYQEEEELLSDRQRRTAYSPPRRTRSLVRRSQANLNSHQNQHSGGKPTKLNAPRRHS